MVNIKDFFFFNLGYLINFSYVPITYVRPTFMNYVV